MAISQELLDILVCDTAELRLQYRSLLALAVR